MPQAAAAAAGRHTHEEQRRKAQPVMPGKLLLLPGHSRARGEDAAALSAASGTGGEEGPAAR